jgi:hypothetical protein
MLFALAALAATPSTYRAGLADPAGWADLSRKNFEGVGEIVIRHKKIVDQDCLEGTTTANLPPDVLLAAATDIPNQPSWSSWKVPASVKLTPGSGEFEYYQVLDNPSPIADRYWFVKATSGRAGEDRVFSWELIDPSVKWASAVAEVQAKWPSAVMTTVNVGDWTFTPQKDTTRIRYRICTDAGGNIPRWVGEIAATSTLPTNIADLVNEVRRRVGR